MIGLWLGSTVITAENCTESTCAVEVFYISPEGENWFNKTCPPNLYSGRNDTKVESVVSLDQIYYFFCIGCYGVSGGFASCECYWNRLSDNFDKLNVCRVRTNNPVLTSLVITDQTFPVLPTTTSTLQPATANSTTDRQPASGVTRVILSVTMSIIVFAILACISVTVCVIVIITVQIHRKRTKSDILRKQVYTEIDNSRASMALYMDLAEIEDQIGFSIPLGLATFQDEENNAVYSSAEDGIQEFTLNSMRNVTEEMYGYITRREKIDEVKPTDPWYENNSQLLKLESTVNNTGKLTFLPVPSFAARNTIHVESPGFETYAGCVYDDSIGKMDYCDGNSCAGTYEDPPGTKMELYNRMSHMRLREINPGTMRIVDTLGTGEFGSVMKAVWESPLGETDVALKVLKEPGGDEDRINTAFLQEAAILGQFSHPNVLRLVGVVTLTVPHMIVTELMQEELRRFLLALQTQHSQELDYDTIAPHFLSFSRQVASGMQHLAERGCIHRDIAARNILLTDRCVCKIADFGMSRRLEAESDYYRVKGANKVPVKWSAPEAIFFKRYSLKSDVWSYGMLLYEIWSVGRKPWPYDDNKSTVEKLACGVNLPPPAGCARAVYELMVSTWHPKPDQRPDMKDIVTRLSESEQSLLTRGELEHRVGKEMFVLGAEPDVADNLYRDLQDKYLSAK